MEICPVIVMVAIIIVECIQKIVDTYGHTCRFLLPQLQIPRHHPSETIYTSYLLNKSELITSCTIAIQLAVLIHQQDGVTQESLSSPMWSV